MLKKKTITLGYYIKDSCNIIKIKPCFFISYLIADIFLTGCYLFVIPSIIIAKYLAIIFPINNLRIFLLNFRKNLLNHKNYSSKNKKKSN
jgi:hypothetical protein